MFQGAKQFRLTVISFLILSLGVPSLLRAAETPGKTGADAQKLEPAAVDIYVEKWDKKFDRGAVNFVAGWTEIVRQPVRLMKSEEKKNKALKFMAGIGQGIGFAVIDTLGGFVNVVSSPLPQFEIPLPHGGIKSEDITGGEPAGYVPVGPEDFESLKN